MPCRLLAAARLPLCAAALFVLLLGSALPPHLAAPGPAAPISDEAAGATLLQQRIDQIIQDGNAASAFWGIHVQTVGSGEVLYSRNAERPFLPASNQKIFTTAAALSAFGPDHRYRTTLSFDGAVDGSVMKGDLILKGSGDPTFGSSEMGGPDPLRRWARELAQMGVTAIRGRLIGDDDVFDDRFYAEGWDVDYVTSQSSRMLGVSIGGLAYGDNLARVQIRAGHPGETPSVRSFPRGAIEIHNDATTRARRRGRGLEIVRSVSTDGVTLIGSVPRGYAGTIFVPVSNPTLYALRSFKGTLQDAGIDVSGLDVVDIDDLRKSLSRDEARPLFVHYSPPLAQIARLTNKESNNFYADQIFRTFSASGTANASENRIKRLLEQAGASTDGISIRDGSGLSRKDLVTPRAMVALLDYMAESDLREVFLASLAEGGEPNSTLRYRLKGVPVRAKTGSIEFARALSGYVELGDGRMAAFALFANNYVTPSYQVTQALDRIVRVMATTSTDA